MNLIKWISTSFTNKDGKVCSKRTTVFALVIMLDYVVFFDLHDVNSIAAMTILIGGIMTILGVKDHYESKKDAVPKREG